MLALILLCIAGAANAVMDTIQFKFSESIFKKYQKITQWANPAVSWRNKWKDGKRENGEKFPGSSTIFVWTTDLWHFAQSIMISCFVLAILVCNRLFSTEYLVLDIILHFVIFKACFSFTFELFWSKLLKSK